MPSFVSAWVGQNRKFWPGESISLRNFTPVVRKVSSQDFLPVLGVPRPTITNQSFWLRGDQMILLTGVQPKPGFGPLEVRPWVNFAKFWPGETSEVYANGLKSFPPGFFNHFGRPTAKIYESVFLTARRPNGAFDWRATKPWIRSFWGATIGQIYPFWAPHGRNLRIGLFDHRATKQGFWLGCDQNLG